MEQSTKFRIISLLSVLLIAALLYLIYYGSFAQVIELKKENVILREKIEKLESQSDYNITELNRLKEKFAKLKEVLFEK